jgi:environmental stress-induced protein Ves
MSLMSSEVLHHLTWENYKVMPWKNGLGTTTQLAIFPHKEEFSLQTFLWRVSIASVETENSFSELIGYG